MLIIAAVISLIIGLIATVYYVIEGRFGRWAALNHFYFGPWSAIDNMSPATRDAARNYNPGKYVRSMSTEALATFMKGGLNEECHRHRKNEAAFAASAKVDARYNKSPTDRVPKTRGEPGVWDHFDEGRWRCGAARKGAPEDYSGGGDPKLICGFGAVGSRPCVVYSFGSRGETSFEKEILKRHPGCAVHIFDPTVWTLRMQGKVPEGAAFHKVGISNLDLEIGYYEGCGIM